MPRNTLLLLPAAALTVVPQGDSMVRPDSVRVTIW